MISVHGQERFALSEPVPVQDIFIEGYEEFDCGDIIRILGWVRRPVPAGGKIVMEKQVVLSVIWPKQAYEAKVLDLAAGVSAPVEMPPRLLLS